MLENIFLSLPMIIVYALLYGVTMKIADLLNEHGLKWFKGSGIVFGILWGLFGSLLVVSDVTVANVILAMVLVYILRGLVDYKNHALATVMIILSFLAFSNFQYGIFFIFFFVFLIAGYLKDVVIPYRKFIKKTKICGWWYPVSGLIFALVTNNWIVFFVLTFFAVFYHIIEYSFENEQEKVAGA